MLKYFKYGYAAFAKQIAANLIVILQMTVLFAVMNVVIGNYNSRDMLYAPYSDILEQEGYYCSVDPLALPSETDENGFVMPISQDVHINNLLPELKGDAYAYMTVSEELFYGQQDYPLQIIFVDDRIYDKLTMPLARGSWVRSENNGGQGVISKSHNGYDVGSRIDVGGKSYTVSGVLTDVTYIPSYTSYTRGKGIKSFYLSRKYSTTDKDYMILPLSQATAGAVGAGGIILVYNEPLSDEDRAYNERLLNENGITLTESIDSIKGQSDVYLVEDLSKSIPLLLCVWVIALSGLVTVCAIQIQKNLRTYAIYYICGSLWRECLIINLVSAAIATLLSAFLALLVMTVGSWFGLNNDLGFVFGMDNLLSSAAVAVITVALSLVIPAFMLKNKQPKTVISEMSM